MFRHGEVMHQGSSLSDPLMFVWLIMPAILIIVYSRFFDRPKPFEMF